MIYQLNSEYYVRALHIKDLEGPYPSWFEDQEVCRYNSHGKFFKTPADFRSYLENISSEDKVVWAICHTIDGHIGNICLDSISLINRNAELTLIIGDKRHWRKNVAYHAANSLLHHGFKKLNLERIWCATASKNISMRNLAKKLGFAEEGCRRSHLYLDGEWDDMIEFGILKKEHSPPPTQRI